MEIYYHGTVQSFDEFTKKKIKPNFTSPQKHLGFFFTDSPDCAALYAKNFKNYSSEGANIRPVYLNMKKSKIEEGSLINEIEEDWLQRDAKEYVRKLKDEGYDSIIFKDVKYKRSSEPDIICNEVVVFESIQINSIFERN